MDSYTVIKNWESWSYLTKYYSTELNALFATIWPFGSAYSKNVFHGLSIRIFSESSNDEKLDQYSGVWYIQNRNYASHTNFQQLTS